MTSSYVAQHLVGQKVRLTVRCDPYYGATLRWGTLRATSANGVVIDGYHDCTGSGASDTAFPVDGVLVRWPDLVDLRPAAHAV